MQVNFNGVSVVSGYNAVKTNSNSNKSFQKTSNSVLELSAYPQNYYLSFTAKKRSYEDLFDRPSDSAVVREIPATSLVPIDSEPTIKEIKSIRSIDDLGDLSGKVALVRADFNVARDKNGNIVDDTRIVEVLPTINKLREEGAKIVLVSHLGKPKGQRNDSMSLNKVAERLSELIDDDIVFVDDSPYSTNVDRAIKKMNNGDVMMLQNIRFFPDEEGKRDLQVVSTEGNPLFVLKANKELLAKRLADISDVIIMDAFGTAHRNHASTSLALLQNKPAAKGLLMEKELDFLPRLLDHPKDFTAVIGGSKISTKIDVLNGLIEKGDVKNIIIGGAMSHAFLKALGYDIQNSYLEKATDEIDPVETAKKVMEKAEAKGVNIVLPSDVVAVKLDEEGNIIDRVQVPVDEIPGGYSAYDIGSSSSKAFSDVICSSKTIFWNGPMGKFEDEGFDKGTNAVAKAISKASKRKGFLSVAGGGDTINAINSSGIDPKTISHISTGGGASLEFIEGKMLPGVKSLIINSRHEF